MSKSPEQPIKDQPQGLPKTPGEAKFRAKEETEQELAREREAASLARLRRKRAGRYPGPLDRQAAREDFKEFMQVPESTKKKSQIAEEILEVGILKDRLAKGIIEKPGQDNK